MFHFKFNIIYIIVIYILFCKTCSSSKPTEIFEGARKFVENYYDNAADADLSRKKWNNTKGASNRINRQINYRQLPGYQTGIPSYLRNHTDDYKPSSNPHYGYHLINNSNNRSAGDNSKYNQGFSTYRYSTTLSYPPQNPVSLRPPYYPTGNESFTISSYPYHSYNNNHNTGSGYGSSLFNNISSPLINYRHNFYDNYSNISSNIFLRNNSFNQNFANNSTLSTIKYPQYKSSSYRPFNINSILNNNSKLNNANSNLSITNLSVYNSRNLSSFNNKKINNLLYSVSLNKTQPGHTYFSTPVHSNIYQSHNNSQYQPNIRLLSNTSSSTYFKHETSTIPAPNISSTKSKFAPDRQNLSTSSYPASISYQYNTSSPTINNYLNQINPTFNNASKYDGIEPNHFYYTGKNKTTAFDPYKIKPYNFSYG